MKNDSILIVILILAFFSFKMISESPSIFYSRYLVKTHNLADFESIVTQTISNYKSGENCNFNVINSVERFQYFIELRCSKRDDNLAFDAKLNEVITAIQNKTKRNLKEAGASDKELMLYKFFDLGNNKQDFSFTRINTILNGVEVSRSIVSNFIITMLATFFAYCALVYLRKTFDK